MFCATKIINPLIVVVQSLSRVQLFATPWTVAHQAPPSMGFLGQKYQSGLPFPSPEDLPNPGIKPDFFFFFTTEPPGNPHINKFKLCIICVCIVLVLFVGEMSTLHK